MAVPKPVGQPPKDPEKRRRRTQPASYGLAEPMKAGTCGVQPELGFEPCEMVRRMWKALENSVESQFFSEADWERACAEMWFANRVYTGEVDLTASNWQRVQNGMNELLISPADKRRAGIQMTRLNSDPDKSAAVSIVADYRSKLTG